MVLSTEKMDFMVSAIQSFYLRELDTITTEQEIILRNIMLTVPVEWMYKNTFYKLINGIFMWDNEKYTAEFIEGCFKQILGIIMNCINYFNDVNKV